MIYLPEINDVNSTPFSWNKLYQKLIEVKVHDLRTYEHSLCHGTDLETTQHIGENLGSKIITSCAFREGHLCWPWESWQCPAPRCTSRSCSWRPGRAWPLCRPPCLHPPRLPFDLHAPIINIDKTVSKMDLKEWFRMTPFNLHPLSLCSTLLWSSPCLRASSPPVMGHSRRLQETFSSSAVNTCHVLNLV